MGFMPNIHEWLRIWGLYFDVYLIMVERYGFWGLIVPFQEFALTRFKEKCLDIDSAIKTQTFAFCV